ncbi:MAG: hypothetical protein ACPL3C_02040 [Pyrobaculum sp.]
MNCPDVVARASAAFEEVSGVLEAEDLALIDEVLDRAKKARDLLARSGCFAQEVLLSLTRGIAELSRRRREVLQRFIEGMKGLSHMEVVDYLYRSSRSDRDLAVKFVEAAQYYLGECRARLLAPRLVRVVNSIPSYVPDEEFRDILAAVVECIAEGRFSREGARRLAEVLRDNISPESLGLLRQYSCILFFLGYVELAASFIKLSRAAPEEVPQLVEGLEERFRPQFMVIAGELGELEGVLSKC